MTTSLEWLDITPEESDQIGKELEIEMESLAQYRLTQLTELIQVVRGQHEEVGLVDNGWWDIWCQETDEHCEVFQGTIEEFAAKLLKDGWAVESLDRFKALCPTCVNREPTLTERELWEDEKVYEARKGE